MEVICFIGGVVDFNDFRSTSVRSEYGVILGVFSVLDDNIDEVKDKGDVILLLVLLLLLFKFVLELFEGFIFCWITVIWLASEKGLCGRLFILELWLDIY